MRWAQKGMTYGNPKWHWVDESKPQEERWGYPSIATVCGEWLPVAGYARVSRIQTETRPALGRNNVCSKCKKAYIATRPELQAAFDLLNDRKDI